MLKPQFDVTAFEEMISRRGRPFLWERARRCPCFDPRTRSPQEVCPFAPSCSGTGYVYATQGTYKATILGITGSKQWAKFGEWMQGDAVMTFPSALLIGDKDRITLSTGEYRETALLVKGKKDTLPAPSTLEIVECHDGIRFYRSGLDFDLVEGALVWKGLRPAEGANYTVLFRAHPVYVVWLQLPQIRAQVAGVTPSGAAVTREMPRKVALRRWIDYTQPGG